MSKWYRRVFGSDSQEPWRWQELADYNSRVGKGVVHEAVYVERMRLQQAEFDAEHRHEIIERRIIERGG